MRAVKVKALRRLYAAWAKTLVVPEGRRVISFRVWRKRVVNK